LGFNMIGKRDTSKADLLRQLTPEDLMAFGMIPEIVGRLPVMVNVDPLDKSALMRILVGHLLEQIAGMRAVHRVTAHLPVAHSFYFGAAKRLAAGIGLLGGRRTRRQQQTGNRSNKLCGRLHHDTSLQNQD
jgi:hypothetical protein